MKSKEQIINEVKICTVWWVKERRKKLEEQLTETMAVNPFVLPFFFDYHGIESFEELADLILAAHLLIGHNTGFGKLIDEKILPNVFGTRKLTADYRKRNIELLDACFNEIDHIVQRPDGNSELMSLKAGKWTIQLTMAMQLNTAFNEILTKYPKIAAKIVVGVFYGKGDDLTDKYEILRGINRGAKHNVIDLTKSVEVHSGRAFWTWLNNGEIHTQEWVLEGIIAGVRESKISEISKKLLQEFRNGFVKKYHDVREEDGSLNWFKLLEKING
jgi:hypothetical protein